MKIKCYLAVSRFYRRFSSLLFSQLFFAYLFRYILTYTILCNRAITIAIAMAMGKWQGKRNRYIKRKPKIINLSFFLKKQMKDERLCFFMLYVENNKDEDEDDGCLSATFFSVTDTEPEIETFPIGSMLKKPFIHLDERGVLFSSMFSPKNSTSCSNYCCERSRRGRQVVISSDFTPRHYKSIPHWTYAERK